MLLVLIFILSVSVANASDFNETLEESSNQDILDVSDESDEITLEDNSSEKSDNVSLKSDNVNAYYKSNSYYVVKFNDSRSDVINVSIGSISYKNQVSDSNGVLKISLNSLQPGTYTARASHNSVVITNYIKILPVVRADDVVKPYGKNFKYSAVFLTSSGNVLKNTNVKIKVDSKVYSVKTSTRGVAKISLKNLKAGKHTVSLIHPNGYILYRTITVKSSISSDNLVKHYLSSKKFKATFYNKKGHALSKKVIKFKVNGKTYKVKTNKKGIAKLNIVSKPKTLKIKSVNTVTGEKQKKTIKILPTLYASSVNTFSDRTTAFNVKLYKNEKLVKKAKVYVYINGNKKTLKTDSNGVATVNFKLAKGTYKFRCVDPYTSYSIKAKVNVRLPSLKAIDMAAHENVSSHFRVTLLNQNGNAAKNTNVLIKLNGVSHTVRTDSNGVANLSFNLTRGTYKVVCQDLATGYTIENKIYVVESSVGKHYNKYGVSDDGLSMLVIGRASAAGELSKYGYDFYKVELLRTCPYCGSNNLYWSIFWAGDETSDTGVFPATGKIESGSAEGQIFCSDCDADFSIFGNVHVTGSSTHLIVIGDPVKSSKEEAYLLLSGDYVAI